MNRNVLVTGSNRGIGLGFVSCYLRRNCQVFACCRNPEKAESLREEERRAGGRLHIISMDVCDEESVARAAEMVGVQTDSLDIIINNAAYGIPDERIETFDPDEALLSFKVNSIGPILVQKCFLSLLKKGTSPKIVNISSESGSITKDAQGRRNYSYSASKSALNLYSRRMVPALKEMGIALVLFHPGWVRTKARNKMAPLSVEEAVEGMYEKIEALTLDQSGRFRISTGEEDHPW